MLANKAPDISSGFSLPGYTHPVSKKMHMWHLFTYYFFHMWEKAIIVILAIFALTEVYKGSVFIIADYKILQEQLNSHTTNSDEVRQILSEAIGVMLGTIINIVMAVRLSTSQERVSRILELILATAIIIWQYQIIAFLQSIDYTIISQSVRF